MHLGEMHIENFKNKFNGVFWMSIRKKTSVEGIDWIVFKVLDTMYSFRYLKIHRMNCNPVCTLEKKEYFQKSARILDCYITLHICPDGYIPAYKIYFFSNPFFSWNFPKRNWSITKDSSEQLEIMYNIWVFCNTSSFSLESFVLKFGGRLQVWRKTTQNRT